MVSFEHWKKTCLEEKEEEEVADKLHNEIIAVILPPPRIRPGKRIRVTSVTKWRPVKKKQLEFYRIAIARTLMIMMVVVVGNNHDEYQLLWLISSSTNLTMMRMIARHARRLKLLIGLCLCESPTTIGGTSELWRCSQLLFSIINSKLKIVFFFKPLLPDQLLICLDSVGDEWKASRLLK